MNGPELLPPEVLPGPTVHPPDPNEEGAPAELPYRHPKPESLAEDTHEAPPPEPTDPPQASFRERLSAATPLLLVSAGCFSLGVYLRWTSTIGPAATFPIWTLFFALGLVAALGGGFFLVVEPEEEGPLVQAPTRRPARRPEVLGRARSSPRRPPLAQDRRPLPAVPSVLVAADPAAGVHDRASAAVPESVPAEPEISRPVAALEMLAELDRVMSDLRPARLNRPQL